MSLFRSSLTQDFENCSEQLKLDHQHFALILKILNQLAYKTAIRNTSVLSTVLDTQVDTVYKYRYSAEHRK